MQFTLLFLNLGGGELFLIALVALMFFGSSKLPEIARNLGKGIREIKDASDNIKREIEQGASEVKRQANLDKLDEELKDKEK